MMASDSRRLDIPCVVGDARHRPACLSDCVQGRPSSAKHSLWRTVLVILLVLFDLLGVIFPFFFCRFMLTLALSLWHWRQPSKPSRTKIQQGVSVQHLKSLKAAKVNQKKRKKEKKKKKNISANSE